MRTKARTKRYPDDQWVFNRRQVSDDQADWARACLLVKHEADMRGDADLSYFASSVGYGCYLKRTKGAK
jgi:hypothetical protein